MSARTRAHAAVMPGLVLEGDEREHLHDHGIQHVGRREASSLSGNGSMLY